MTWIIAPPIPPPMGTQFRRLSNQISVNGSVNVSEEYTRKHSTEEQKAAKKAATPISNWDSVVCSHHSVVAPHTIAQCVSFIGNHLLGPFFSFQHFPFIQKETLLFMVLGVVVKTSQEKWIFLIFVHTIHSIHSYYSVFWYFDTPVGQSVSQWVGR